MNTSVLYSLVGMPNDERMMFSLILLLDYIGVTYPKIAYIYVYIYE